LNKKEKMFINRKSELSFLEQAWDSDRAELIVVYGRRRVGKTALLRTFCTDRPGAFWVASLSSEAILRQSFTNALWQATHPNAADAGFTFETWERAFQAMGELAEDKRHVVVIDEFPYLVSAASEVSSVLQKVWDEYLQNTKLMLVLCGSHLGMMEREILMYRAPLYGRRTGQLRLRSLSLEAVGEYFSHYNHIEQIETYAVLGGIPAYLAQFDDRKSLLDNIEHRILNPASYLYMEPQFLLREELQEPRNYFAILQSVAQGKTRLNQIVQATGMERGPVSRYLSVLQELHLVERRVPATEKRPDKSRRGIYRIRDPFLAFWFRFVTPYVSILEGGRVDYVVQRLETELSIFIGPVFEDICREWVMRQSVAENLPFVPERVGAWWDRSEEIDVVAINDLEKTVLVGECKWTTKRMGVGVLQDLKRKAQALEVMGRWEKMSYILFSKAGFSDNLLAIAASEGVRLIHAKDLVVNQG